MGERGIQWRRGMGGRGVRQLFNYSVYTSSGMLNARRMRQARAEGYCSIIIITLLAEIEMRAAVRTGVEHTKYTHRHIPKHCSAADLNSEIVASVRRMNEQAKKVNSSCERGKITSIIRCN